MSVHRPTQALTNICLRSVFLGWRDSSVVKSASCSCRAPRLDPQRLHEGSQPSNSNSREFLGVQTQGTHVVHSQPCKHCKRNSHIDKIKIKYISYFLCTIDKIIYEFLF